jgi:hypothetical protein
VTVSTSTDTTEDDASGGRWPGDRSWTIDSGNGARPCYRFPLPVRLCGLVVLLLTAPALAQNAVGLHADQWTQGRALFTLGAVAPPGTQTSATERFTVANTPVGLTQAFSGAWFFRSWFGVGADLRVEPFRHFPTTQGQPLPSPSDMAESTRRYLSVSGNVLGLLRWQPTLLFGLELQLGWAAGTRPLIIPGPDVKGLFTTGPVAGVAVNLDLTRHVWLQLYGRAELITATTAVSPYGQLAGAGLTFGLQSRVASFSVGPVELGVGLFAEVNPSNLVGPENVPGEAVRARVDSTLIRLGAGAVATLRRPAPDVVVEPGVTLRRLKGRVVKGDRSKVTGAAVTIGTVSRTSDATGAFEVADLAAGSYTVKATAPGLRAASVDVVVGSGVTETELVLEAPTGPGRVAGVVRAGPDQPLAGAKVVSGTQTVTTSATGAYTLASVGPGAVKVKVTLEGYAPADEVVQVPPEGEASLDVTLEPVAQRTKAKIRGVISSAAGPVAKATVRIVELKLKQAVKPDGRFEADVPGGRYTVIIEAPRHVTQTKTVEVADGDQAIFQIELEKVR